MSFSSLTAIVCAVGVVLLTIPAHAQTGSKADQQSATAPETALSGAMLNQCLKTNGGISAAAGPNLVARYNPAATEFLVERLRKNRPNVAAARAASIRGYAVTYKAPIVGENVRICYFGRKGADTIYLTKIELLNGKKYDRLSEGRMIDEAENGLLDRPLSASERFFR